MNKLDWDYTDLADSYLKRPAYSAEAIDEMLKIAQPDEVCDVEAGTGILTVMLAEKGLHIKAIEPNDAMRADGMEITAHFKNVHWSLGCGENTGQPNNDFDLVVFGSSFNVTDRLQALKETKRILKPKGWFS